MLREGRNNVTKKGLALSNNRKHLRSVLLSSAAAFLATTSVAQNTSEFTGEVSLTARTFTSDGALPGQPTSGTSFIGEAELGWRGSVGPGQLVFEVYGRGDDRTDTGLIDVPKAYYFQDNGSWNVLVGQDVAFWGVAESTNIVNVINQDDVNYRFDEERKLGQPMVNLGFNLGGGTLNAYALLGFREPNYGGSETRPRFSVFPVADEAMFEEDGGEDYDFALRYASTVSMGAGSLDYAVSYFYGTSRAAVLLPGCSGASATVSRATCNAVNSDIAGAFEGLSSGGSDLGSAVTAASSPTTQAFLAGGDGVGTIPYYQEMNQLGLELAYATGDWVLKFEGFGRNASDETFYAGIFGAEYRIANAFGGQGDLTLAGEYITDGRSSRQPLTIFDDDVFLSARYDFNNAWGTSLSFNGLYDLDTEGQYYNIELTTRLADSISLNMIASQIMSDDPADPLTAFDKDDNYEITLSYFF